AAGGMITLQPMQVLNNALIFDAADTSASDEVWRSDGTAAGTFRLKDCRPGPVSSQPQAFRTVGGRVFFECDDGTHGLELWATDGTAAGTALVKDINGGSGNSFPIALGAIGNVGYFYVRFD